MTIPCQVGGGKRHLERFCGNSVPGGRQEKDTWNAFAGIPCQVGGRKRTPGTLSREFRGRWAAGRCYLERFRGNSVAGGRRGDATWNAFAGIPWQVDGRMGHLERFCGDSVPGGKRDETPGTLSQENRGRWTAGRDTWNAFAGIP